MKSALIFILAISVLWSGAGCTAPSGIATPAEPVLTSKPASLDFIEVTTTSSLTGTDAEKTSLNDRIASALRETGLFANVNGDIADNPSGEGIKVEAEIKAIKKVSANSRVWLGGLAGQARITIQVTVFDMSSGKPVETFEAIGKSGKSAWAGATDEAVQRAAEATAAKIVQLNVRTAQ